MPEADVYHRANQLLFHDTGDPLHVLVRYYLPSKIRHEVTTLSAPIDELTPDARDGTGYKT